MKLAQGWTANDTLSSLNRNIRRRSRREEFTRAIRDRFYRFQDLFEAAHTHGFELIGTALQSACIVLIAVCAVAQVARYVQSHLPHHFLGW